MKSMKRALGTHYVGFGVLALTLLLPGWYFAYEFSVALAISTGVVVSLYFVIAVIVYRSMFTMDVREIVELELGRDKCKAVHKFLEKAVEKTSDPVARAELYALRGDVFRREQKDEQAITFYEQAVKGEKFPQSWKAYYALGSLYARGTRKQTDKALNAFVAAYQARLDFRVPNDRTAASICRQISDICRRKGALVDAANWFSLEMSLREDLLDFDLSRRADDKIREGHEALEKKESVRALAAFKTAIDLLVLPLTAKHERVADLHLQIIKLYLDHLDIPDNIKMAGDHHEYVLASRMSYLALPEQEPSTSQQIRDRVSLKLKDALINSADEYFNRARTAAFKNDYRQATKLRNQAVDLYKGALEITNAFFGSQSAQSIMIHHKLGVSWKWISYDNDDSSQGKHHLLKVSGYYSRHPKSMTIRDAATLYVDIGGLYAMQRDYVECTRWRLEAYKALLQGEYDAQDLAAIELPLKSCFDELNTGVPFKDFLASEGISAVIESTLSKEKLPSGIYQITMKLKDVDEPWITHVGG